MNTFCITSLGCKVNQYESRQIAQMLVKQGLRQVDTALKADLAIVHTCCVTHIASSKSRQLLRKNLGSGSNCKVVATGCLPQAGELETDGLGSEVIFISKKDNLSEALLKIIQTPKTITGNCEQKTIAHNPISKTGNGDKIKNKNELSCTKSKKIANTCKIVDILDTFHDQTRAFLKIQDGCDGFCSYCIIPKIRTQIFSPDEETVLNEARAFIAAGHTEIVLTGIFLGAYGQDTVKRSRWKADKQGLFTNLVDKLAALDGLKRLRLSSLEPGDITEDLLGLFSKHENLVPHLHLPLQSGSEQILKKMNRQYTADQFIRSVERVRQVLDRPALTADIIAGFPGETQQDFQDSIDMANFAGFAKIHVFSFSKRKGTAAEKMPDQLPPQVIKERSEILRKLDEKLQHDFRMQFHGERISVIVEDEKKQTGRCERYFEVKLKNTNLKKRAFTYAILDNDCYHASPSL